MSKISEQKALEAYPMVNPPYSNSDEPKLNVENAYRREGYIQGYDQAFQYFMKKAEGFLTGRIVLCFRVSWTEQQTPFLDFTIKDIVEQFKNYIEDEM